MVVCCELCEREFDYPCMLDRHLNRKNPCKDSVTKMLVCKIDEGTIQCKYCLKIFRRKDNLKLHMKEHCTGVNDNISIYERELGIKTNNTTDLSCRYCTKTYTNRSGLYKHNRKGCPKKYEYEKFLERKVLRGRNEAAHTVQNINNTTNNTTNNTIHITLPPMRAFGNENVDYITTKFLLEELKKCGNMNDMSTVVGNFTRMIHANPAHPENHNVQLRSLNGGFAKVFNGTSFEDRQSLDVQDVILQNIGKLVTNKCDELDMEEGLNTKQIEQAREAIDEDVICQDRSRTVSTYRAKVKSALHNNRTTIFTTQKLKEENKLDTE